jgi:hypothetical protein
MHMIDQSSPFTQQSLTNTCSHFTRSSGMRCFSHKQVKNGEEYNMSVVHDRARSTRERGASANTCNRCRLADEFTWKRAFAGTNCGFLSRAISPVITTVARDHGNGVAPALILAPSICPRPFP